MSNGKFFSGLTERMMTRSGGPNRQQSSLFWDDEEIVQPKPRRIIQQTQNQQSPDIDETNQLKSPKDRFNQQQQTPVNDFNSTFNSKSNSRDCEPVDKYHRKNQGLTSNIEFYDFADSSKVTRNNKLLSPNNDSGRKRISFNENEKNQVESNNDINDIEIKTKQMTVTEKKNGTERNSFLDDNPFNQEWDDTRTYRKNRNEQDTFRKQNYNNGISDGNNSRRIPITLTNENDYFDNSRVQTNLQINCNNMKKSSIFNDYDDDYNKKSTIKSNHVIKKNEKIRETVNDTPYEAKNRAHEHLKSNIFFFSDSDNNNENQHKQRRSVRDSAIGRIGVGLPD